MKIDYSKLLTYLISAGANMLGNLLIMLTLVWILPSEAYAGFALVKVTLIIVTSICGLGLSQAAVKWVNLSKIKKTEIINNIFSISIVLGAFGGIILASLLYLIQEKTFYQITITETILLILVCVSYMANNELVNWHRACHDAKLHGILNSSRIILQLIFIIAFCYIIKNIYGYIYGITMAEVLFVIFNISYLKLYKYQKINTILLKNMIKYGFPHSLVIASGFLLNYVDRYMIANLTDDIRLVSYYDTSYMLATSFLALLIRPFNLYLFPAYMKIYKINGTKTTLEFLNKNQNLILYLTSAITVFLLIAKDIAIRFILPQEYYVGSSIMGQIAFATILNGLFMISCAGLYIKDNTMIAGLAAIIAVITNIITNIFLIPKYGIIGAAYSTVLGSLIQLYVGYYFSKKVIKLKLPIIRLSIIFLFINLIEFYLINNAS